MLTEKQIVDKIEINADGQMSIRTATVIERDGIEIARSFHRHVITPGDDVSGEDPRVANIANVDWTLERIAVIRSAQREPI